MAEVLFYHLQRQPLDAVLPQLVERSLARGWRVAVQVGSPERLSALDDHLWTYAEDSFLPHVLDREPGASEEAVVLTSSPDNVNHAAVRFLVDGASLPPDISMYERVVVMFDGQDESALASARDMWKQVRTGGHEATYWQQAESGRWEKKA
jgi:DNA polymerase-3 subunit chi